MISEIFILPAVALVTITSLVLLISRDWRESLVALAIQYLGVFVLVAISWSLEMAAAKVVAGWMAGAVLGVAAINAPGSWQEEASLWPSGRLFRLLAAGLVGLTVYSLAPRASSWMAGLMLEGIWGGLILIGMGLLLLGLTAQPLRVAIGLLTVVSGFEILYAAEETSILVGGLLAGVTLGIALAGAYMLSAPTMEEIE